jgi:hypothetical protein
VWRPCLLESRPSSARYPRRKSGVHAQGALQARTPAVRYQRTDRPKDWRAELPSVQCRTPASVSRAPGAAQATRMITAALPGVADNLHYVNRSLPPRPRPGPTVPAQRSWCPVSRDLVHVSLELDQSTRASHLIWSARRCGPLRVSLDLVQDMRCLT